MSIFHSLKVKNIIKETKDAVSIIFDIPTDLQNDFSFIAGQYITLKTTINGEEIRRAYSLCSSPKSNEIKVAVKAVEDGKFSVYATSKLTTGDTLDVSKPEGKFLLEPQSGKNYLGFAAGSGITPLLAMVKSVLENESSSTFTLIYGNKTTEETIFGNELNDLAIKYHSNFKLHYVLSRETKEGILTGRVDSEKVNIITKDIYKNVSFDTAFLCGPEEMITNVTDGLRSNGFNDDQIAFELFTASVDEEAAAQVQGGVCSSCLAKVTEGKAVMTKNFIVTDEEVAEGFILTCQAYPVTPKITIDFDDV